jgi:hypothetical protein
MLNEPFPVPFIAREQYETFRALKGTDLPDTYDVWLQLHTKQKVERGRIGYDVKEIRINPDEFTRFYTSRRIAPNLKTLADFSAEKFAGNSY